MLLLKPIQSNHRRKILEYPARHPKTTLPPAPFPKTSPFLAHHRNAMSFPVLWQRLTRIPGQALIHGAQSGTGTDSGAQSGTGTDSGTQSGTGTDSGTQSGTGTDSGTQSGTGIDSGAQSGTGIDSGAQSGTGIDSGAQTGTGIDSGAQSGTGMINLESQSHRVTTHR